MSEISVRLFKRILRVRESKRQHWRQNIPILAPVQLKSVEYQDGKFRHRRSRNEVAMWSCPARTSEGSSAWIFSTGGRENSRLELVARGGLRAAIDGEGRPASNQQSRVGGIIAVTRGGRSYWSDIKMWTTPNVLYHGIQRDDKTPWHFGARGRAEADPIHRLTIIAKHLRHLPDQAYIGSRELESVHGQTTSACKVLEEVVVVYSSHLGFGGRSAGKCVAMAVLGCGRNSGE
ncbi:hypothetical protein DFP72DRAFT_850870 [Ephemerocybe angulata]|uniref:Uncharacterized protein n=1 Tax=Ephemerocybe angulata TaxID=980116 RepID=A0A8H6M339_9AGAR|nr:hypothetical protein DFP72DRAFT_850870 [Tulosesus angulatus]